MDSGECINVNGISDSGRREFLSKVMAHPSMPTEFHPGSGWAKLSECQCIRRILLETLLKCGSIIHPQDLSSGEARAVRMAPEILKLLQEIPDLYSELDQLLSTLCGGGVVDLGGLDNKDVRKALCNCFERIGVDKSEGGSKYSFCLPEFDGDVVRSALRHHVDVLVEISKLGAMQKQSKESAGVASLPEANGDASSMSSESGDEASSDTE